MDSNAVEIAKLFLERFGPFEALAACICIIIAYQSPKLVRELFRGIALLRKTKTPRLTSSSRRQPVSAPDSSPTPSSLR